MSNDPFVPVQDPNLVLAVELMPDVRAQIEQGLDDPEGWWVRAVLSTFESIARDFGYEIEKVHMHFRGNFVWYRGGRYRIALELDRDSGSLTGELWILEDLGALAHPRAISFASLLSTRAETDDWEPPDDPKALTESSVRDVLEHWAAGLRTYAPDVLAGEIPAGVPWGRLW